MITYNEIYEASRAERYSEKLQKLPKNFISDVSSYLEEKKQTELGSEDAFSDIALKTKKQLENAITLFKELMLRRRKKILNLVLIAAETGISKQDFNNMFEIEKELFEEFMKCIDANSIKLNELLNNKTKKQETNKLVVFVENVSELVNVDGGKIGPYEKGQIANIPNEIANILIEGNKAELVNSE
jgi:DNA replication initiation complex subunit (GINS family)